MKIAITGTGGVGKTTLANALAETLNIPVLTENMQDLVAVIGQLAAVQKSSPPASSAQIKSLQLQYQQVCIAWLNNRAQAQQDTPNFVADRFAIDLLARLIMPTAQKPSEEMIEKVIVECKRQSAMLDLIIMPPLVRLAAPDTKNESGLKRHDALSMKLFSHSLNRGLIEQLLNVPRLYIPTSAKTTEQRVAVVQKALMKLNIKRSIVSTH